MAVLAAFMLRADAKQSLPDYLDERIAKSIGAPVMPDPRDVKGFDEFYARHRRGLAIEREAVKSLDRAFSVAEGPALGPEAEASEDL
jgi:hypothetical protein